LLTVERLRNHFLEFHLLKSFVVPKYLVVSFPKDCIGFEKYIPEYLKHGVNILTFLDIKTTNFRSLQHNHELVFWLVDTPDKLHCAQDSYKLIAQSNPTVTSYLTIVRAQRKVSQGTIIAYIPVGTPSVDMRSGAQRSLTHRLQICRMTSTLETLNVESFGPNGQTLAFHALIQNCTAIVLFDTGATHSFVNETFITQNNIPLRILPETALVADGRELKIQGSVTVKLAFGSLSMNHLLRVTNLGYQFDAILGMDWLSKYKCILNCANHTCKIHKGSVTHTLSLKPVINQVSTKLHINSFQLQKEANKQCVVFAIKVDQIPLEDEYDENLAWNLSHLEEVEIPKPLMPLLNEYQDVFPAEMPKGLPPARQTGHTIELIEGAKPMFRPLYRLSPFEHEEVRTQITDLLDKGWIEPSSSPFGAPILFVQKKDKSLRMCVDYRALNQQTVKNRYALPRIDDLIDQLSGAQYFTSLDLAQGYHQIRVTKEDVPKTAFRTPLGHFQYLVLPFGLTNAPATFQSTMNDMLREHIGKSVLVYLDDILIYSRTPTEHVDHVRNVLEILRKHRFYAKLTKCQFMTDQLLYLGHIISNKGLQPDPAKLAALQNWKTPMNAHDVRSFLGFGNYFRKFVQGYSSLVLPLTELTKKDKLFEWTPKCEEAFRGLIWNLSNAPVLAIADPQHPYEVVCDASGWALGAVLLQNNRPIAFESRKMAPAELNYTVSEQELLAVVYALRTWRCYLEGCKGLVIITDHKPNSYLTSQDMLSRRQSRWSEFLSRFDYELVYRPGRTNVADPLSRLRVGAITRSLARDNEEIRITGAKDLQTLVTTVDPNEGANGEYTATEPPRVCPVDHVTQGNILSWISSEYSYDPMFRGDQAGQKEQTPSTLTRDSHSGLYYQNGKIYVPACKELRLRLISEHHDTRYSGHFGIAKTHANITRDFIWPGLRSDVKSYVLTCSTCQRSKPSHLRPAGKLMPLPIPARRWTSVGMDFIMELPLTRRGYSAILVFVDRLTKMVHLAATHTDVSAVETAQLYVDNVVKHHGFQSDLVSDRDPRFTGKFWRQVCELVGTRQNLSTAFHPETDGQTERVNRVIGEYLRSFVNEKQDNWDMLLPMAEFALNNSVHTSSGFTPFYLNSGQHPLNPLTIGQSGYRNLPPAGGDTRLLPAVEDFVKNISEVVHQAKTHLRAAQDRQKSYADKGRRELSFSVGDLVLLKTKNLRLKTTGKQKLLPKWIGPFPVVRVIGNVAYKLELPITMKCHPVFHVSNLQPYRSDGRVQPPPIPLDVSGEAEFEVEQVLLHRDIKSGKRHKREFLIKWLGYGPEHNSWEPSSSMRCDELIAKYWEATQAAQRARDRLRKGS
jgi:Reverse transcriptase (RNA-dependent DNA polymerase)/RNase H-like domain found in reverse transcriptase/Integrase zinc binding domain/Retroviral aspartyl protease/Chromo (CHRromatin Organisation MOdifier) domain